MSAGGKFITLLVLQAPVVVPQIGVLPSRVSKRNGLSRHLSQKRIKEIEFHPLLKMWV